MSVEEEEGAIVDVEGCTQPLSHLLDRSPAGHAYLTLLTVAWSWSPPRPTPQHAFLPTSSPASTPTLTHPSHQTGTRQTPPIVATFFFRLSLLKRGFEFFFGSKMNFGLISLYREMEDEWLVGKSRFGINSFVNWCGRVRAFVSRSYSGYHVTGGRPINARRISDRTSSLLLRLLSTGLRRLRTPRLRPILALQLPSFHFRGCYFSDWSYFLFFFFLFFPFWWFINWEKSFSFNMVWRRMNFFRGWWVNTLEKLNFVFTFWCGKGVEFLKTVRKKEEKGFCIWKGNAFFDGPFKLGVASCCPFLCS